MLYSGKPTTSSYSEKLLAKPIELTTLVGVHQCNNLSSLFERKHNVSLSVVGAVDQRDLRGG